MKIKKLIIPLILGVLMLPAAFSVACKDKGTQNEQAGGIDVSVTGQFYNISEGLTHNLITEEDVDDICYNFNRGGCIPGLTEEEKDKFRIIYLNDLRKQPYLYMTDDKIRECYKDYYVGYYGKYYGKFNNWYYALTIYDNKNCDIPDSADDDNSNKEFSRETIIYSIGIKLVTIDKK